MTLATIDDDAENAFLADAVDGLSTLTWFVGLNDWVDEGTFVWTFGGSDYDAFGGGEPNGDDCVVLNGPSVGDEEWADDSCTTARRFVCEEIGGCTPVTWHADGDGDGFGDDNEVVLACHAPSGFTAAGGDCDDGDGGVHPNATEVIADGVDQDCDGGDRCYRDNDGDDHGTAAGVSSADLVCTDAGESTIDDDCDDGDVAATRGAPRPAATARTATATATAARPRTRTATACRSTSRTRSAGAIARGHRRRRLRRPDPDPPGRHRRRREPRHRRPRRRRRHYPRPRSRGWPRQCRRRRGLPNYLDDDSDGSASPMRRGHGRRRRRRRPRTYARPRRRPDIAASGCGSRRDGDRAGPSLADFRRRRPRRPVRGGEHREARPTPTATGSRRRRRRRGDSVDTIAEDRDLDGDPRRRHRRRRGSGLPRPRRRRRRGRPSSTRTATATALSPGTTTPTATSSPTT